MNAVKQLVGVVAVLVFTSTSNGCASLSAADASSTPCTTTLGSPIENFCQVTPSVLWRGAKPTTSDAAWLIEHGVRTVVNLELLHDDETAFVDARISDADGHKLTYFRVRDWEPNALVAPSLLDDHVAHFLAILKTQQKPIYVHCRAGKNRTGVMIAAYRVLIDGAKIEDAINEMRWYHGQWFLADKAYIRSLSVEHRTKILEASQAWVARLEPVARISCQGHVCMNANP